MTTLRLHSNGLVNAPGMTRFIGAIRYDSFGNVPDKDVLARLWFVSTCFPDMPSGAALAWATGKAKTSTDGTTLLLSWDDGEEAAGEGRG